MKLRNTAIAAALSLIPVGQPLVIGTGAALTTSAVMLSIAGKAQAESAEFYFERALKKQNEEGDYYGAISDYNKVIEKKEVSTNNLATTYYNRGKAKSDIKDYKGALSDFNKTLQITPDDEMVYGSRGFAKMYLDDRRGGCADWRKASSLGYENATKWVKETC